MTPDKVQNALKMTLNGINVIYNNSKLSITRSFFLSKRLFFNNNRVLGHFLNSHVGKCEQNIFEKEISHSTFVLSYE